MNARKRTERLLFVTLLLLTIGTTASAYVDPGTGSLITQLVIAGSLGAIFAVKNFWGGLWKSLARRVKSHSPRKGEDVV